MDVAIGNGGGFKPQDLFIIVEASATLVVQDDDPFEAMGVAVI